MQSSFPNKFAYIINMILQVFFEENNKFSEYIHNNNAKHKTHYFIFVNEDPC